MKQAAALAATTILALTGCGNNEPASQKTQAPEQAAPGTPTAIHSLVVDDDKLLIATHDGLWQHTAGRDRAEPIGDSRRDVMALTALGNRLISSGHPDPHDREGQPANVGIIESRNQGNSWQPIALAGKVDIHAIAAAGNTIYGYDIVQEQLIGSGDIGRTWKAVKGITAVTSLAVSPTDASNVLAGTDQGLKHTVNAGRSWQTIDRSNAIVAFSNRHAWAIDRRGRVRRSNPAATSWQTVGSLPSAPAALAATDTDLIVALENGQILESADNGATFTKRVPQ